MSDYKWYRGAIIPVENPKELSLEELAKDIITSSLGSEYKLWHDTYLEELKYEYEDNYYVGQDTIYRILAKKLHDPTDYRAEATRRSDIIDYDLAYYNGGCSFYEAMDDALAKLEQKERSR